MSLAGTRIDGHYTLLRPLGKGATSTVYLALGDDGEPYTVKLFPAHLLAQAVRESQMRVRGPHLAEVMLLCEVEGQPAVVLRFTRGVELFTRYRFRPALIYETQAYCCTLSNILEALSAMHAGGILHRDVKADNILVRPSGEAQLLDYDLSGPVSEIFDLPRRIGTAAFQSPEAVRGEALGPQSDLYGVGVLMYWGLHGTLPGDGPLSRREETHREEALSDLCWKLLDPDPATRPSSAAKVRAELLRTRAMQALPGA